MKNYIKIATLSLCLTLAGCGLTNPYEKWLDAYPENPDRLLPSKLKEVLCEEGKIWKTDCNGTYVYFSFGKDWSVESDSEAIQLATSDKFSLVSKGDDAVALTINGAGHLPYFIDDADETYYVTEYSSTSIKATGKTLGTELTFVPATATELNAMQEEKEPILFKLRVFKRFVDAECGSAVLRNSQGEFLARVSVDSKTSSAKFDIMDNRELTHVAVSVDATEATGDKCLTFKAPVTVLGEEVTGLQLDDETSSIKLIGTNAFRVTNNSGARKYWLSGDYETFYLNVFDGTGDAEESIIDELVPHDEWNGIEFNDRDTRPIIYCPRHNDDGHYWYVYFDSFKNGAAELSSVYKDVVFMQKDLGYMDDPWPDYPSVYNEVWAGYPRLLNFYYEESGIFLVLDADSENDYLWFVSTTSEYWIKAQREKE